MKRLIVGLLVVIGFISTLVANSNAERICQRAVMNTGQGNGYAVGYCRGTSYSEAKWSCISNYTSSGKSISFGIGACSNY
jgi:hypothetical protein